jgi:alkyl sulfatase BDS1-like metallo-beta-lactamase superfamily hydrolase
MTSYPKQLFEDETLAVVCEHCPTVHPQVAERSKVFRRRVFEFGPGTYAAIEYLGSSVMVVGPEGAVVVGALSHLTDGELVAKHFAALRGDKPISAVVYNDSLADNYGGVEAFVSENDASAGKVAIIAHETFERVMLDNLGNVSDVAAWRGAYQAGAFLPKGPEGLVHTGAIAYSRGKVSYIAPNVLIKDQWQGSPGGVRTEIYHFPAESDDGIVTWFPEQKTLVIGHVLFGDLLPQVYAQRGIVRSPKRWYKGIESLIDFVQQRDVEYMVPMHWFEPIVGIERIMEVLMINRDTLQFIADQSARHINKGWRPDDLATLSLPPHLAHHPELQEHYGRLQQHLRQQYVDSLGWFEGDPTFLDPMPELERATRYVAAMGGRDAVLDRARAAVASGDRLWAAELSTLLIRIDRNDPDARALKASTLRELGYAAPNATYRNWFLSSALELEGKLPDVRMDKSAFVPAKILAALPPIEVLETLKARLMAERVFDLDYRMSLRFDDRDESATVHVRRGVLAVTKGASANADAELNLSTSTLHDLVNNRLTLADAIDSGKLVLVRGQRSVLQRIESSFEPATHGSVSIAMPVNRQD